MFPESISAEEIEQLPLRAFEGPITVISEKGEDYAEAIDYLSAQKIIGFDTETKPSFAQGASHNKVALLQLSGKDKAYLFRLHQIGLTNEVLKILSDPDILKIGAAVADDVRGLAKHTKFPPRGFVDLQILSQHYGIKDKSVKKMAAIILGIKVSKAQQLSNWEARVLSGAQLKYAATDAWVCLEMYEALLKCEKTVSEEEALKMPALVVPREPRPKRPPQPQNPQRTPEEKKAIATKKRRERRKRAKIRKREAERAAAAASAAAVTIQEVLDYSQKD